MNAATTAANIATHKRNHAIHAVAAGVAALMSNALAPAYIAKPRNLDSNCGWRC